MNRRQFIRFSGKAAVLVPAATFNQLAQLVKQPRNPMPKIEDGSILTSEFMNDLISRLNNLEESL